MTYLSLKVESRGVFPESSVRFRLIPSFSRYVAADLLSQAEHDEMASAILVTTSEELAEKVSL